MSVCVGLSLGLSQTYVVISGSMSGVCRYVRMSGLMSGSMLGVCRYVRMSGSICGSMSDVCRYLPMCGSISGSKSDVCRYLPISGSMSGSKSDVCRYLPICGSISGSMSDVCPYVRISGSMCGSISPSPTTVRHKPHSVAYSWGGMAAYHRHVRSFGATHGSTFLYWRTMRPKSRVLPVVRMSDVCRYDRIHVQDGLRPSTFRATAKGCGIEKRPSRYATALEYESKARLICGSHNRSRRNPWRRSGLSRECRA